jgi:hypothetical protein
MNEARLAPDMFNLARQVQNAADVAKIGAARLSGEAPPSHPDNETTFDDLKGRIAKRPSKLMSAGTVVLPCRRAANRMSSRAAVTI